jgi:hypothetical protein
MAEPPVIPLSIRFFVEKLRKLLGKEEISTTEEYFPYVFAVGNPLPQCEGGAVGAFFFKLSHIEENWDGEEALEKEMDLEIFDCREEEKIDAYFCDWGAYEKAGAKECIRQYRLRHEFKNNRLITDYFH